MKIKKMREIAYYSPNFEEDGLKTKEDITFKPIEVKDLIKRPLKTENEVHNYIIKENLNEVPVETYLCYKDNNTVKILGYQIIEA